MVKKSISREVPLAEITLRRYEKPEDLSKRELIRKICLSSVLLQPVFSRDVIVDPFQVMLQASKPISSEEVQEKVVTLRKSQKIPLLGIAPSNIRRQLKRLRDLFMVEKIKNDYRITENEKLHVIFEEKIEKYYLPSITQRVKEYFKAIK